jgi:hypothetical protein
MAKESFVGNSAIILSRKIRSFASPAFAGFAFSLIINFLNNETMFYLKKAVFKQQTFAVYLLPSHVNKISNS